MPPRHLALCAALLLTLAACGGGSKSQAGGDATMRPGEDCLGCHQEFTAAGTVYASSTGTQGVAGVTVRIFGMSQDVTLTTNSAGNFYTTVNFGYGNSATVQVMGATQQMTNQQLTSRSIGGCNSCHVPAGQGRVHVP